ncbi:MAG: hypothetical protein II833_06975, partial [Pseudobutyrivibrio sp.]|nr:hypothetical protein [Pseudobutyrivibrio sp.]
TIANAAYLSWWKNEVVNLPLDPDEYLLSLQSKKSSNENKHIEPLCDNSNYGKYSDRWMVKW